MLDRDARRLQAELRRIEPRLSRDIGKLDSLARVYFQGHPNLLGHDQLVQYLRQSDRYVLSMAERPQGHTRVSGTRRMTIPAAPFREAGFKPGDMLRVDAEGAGRVVLTRVEELVDRYSGCLDTGGTLRGRIDGLRREWP